MKALLASHLLAESPLGSLVSAGAPFTSAHCWCTEPFQQQHIWSVGTSSRCLLVLCFAQRSSLVHSVSCAMCSLQPALPWCPSLLWCPFPVLMSANNFIKIFVAWLWCLYSISYVKWSYWEPRQFSNLMSCPYTTKTFTSSTSVTFGTSFIHSAVNPLVWNVFVLFCCLFSCGTVLAAALQWNSACAQYQGADKCCSMSQTQLEVPGTGGCGSAAWLQ